MAAFLQVIDRDGAVPALREQVATAVQRLGAALAKRGRWAEALAAFQQVIDRYGDDPAPALREQVAMALYNLGAVLAGLGRWAEALAAFQQVIDRYGDDPALREHVDRATICLQKSTEARRSD